MQFRFNRAASFCASLGLALLLAATGCRSYEKETAPVRGTVTLDGQPIPGATVMCAPPSGRAASGVVGPDGSFALSTYGKGDGAIIGRHPVAVFPPSPLNEAAVMPAWAAKLPMKYQNTASSGLVCEVKRGEDNVLTIELSSTAR